MNMKKALNASCSEEIVTIEEYVKISEVLKNLNSTDFGTQGYLS